MVHTSVLSKDIFHFIFHVYTRQLRCSQTKVKPSQHGSISHRLQFRNFLVTTTTIIICIFPTWRQTQYTNTQPKKSSSTINVTKLPCLLRQQSPKTHTRPSLDYYKNIINHLKHTKPPTHYYLHKSCRLLLASHQMNNIYHTRILTPLDSSRIRY